MGEVHGFTSDQVRCSAERFCGRQLFPTVGCSTVRFGCGSSLFSGTPDGCAARFGTHLAKLGVQLGLVFLFPGLSLLFPTDQLCNRRTV